MSEKLKGTEGQIVELNQQLESAAEVEAKLRDGLGTLEEEKESAESQNNASNVEIEDLKAALEKAEQVNLEDREELEESHHAEMSKVNSEHEAFVEQLKGQVSEYEGIANELRESLTKMKNLRQEESDHHKQEMAEREENWGEIVSQLEEKMEKKEADSKEQEQVFKDKIAELEAQVSKQEFLPGGYTSM